jgi:hypothetical protein
MQCVYLLLNGPTGTEFFSVRKSMPDILRVEKVCRAYYEGKTSLALFLQWFYDGVGLLSLGQIWDVCEWYGVSKRFAKWLASLRSGHFQSVRSVTPPASMAITQHP